NPEPLVADLAIHALDMVITDAPVAPTIKVRAFNHLLHEGGLTVFGSTKLHARYAKGFPASLNGAPFLMPTDNAQMRRTLDQWFADRNWRPTIVGEFEDSAVLKTFGMEGEGLFAAPALVAEEIKSHYRVKALGELEGAKDRLYAITLDRKVRNPAVMSIIEAAKRL
ncbi:MAG: LysR family transcriptional regulator, partial [Gemmatimonadetes bacterium]|nr:LysR family transcriptional regulator [Gemmatimonadota bacterium]